jgi:hypothetical protein
VKVKSIQGYKPNCQMHALVNVGICCYKTAKKYNTLLKNEHVKVCRKYKIKPYHVENDIYHDIKFTHDTLIKLNINFKFIEYKKPININRLKYKKCIINIKYQNDNDIHAICKKGNYIYNSHYKTAKHINKCDYKVLSVFVLK